MNEEESYFYTLLLLRGRNIKRKNHFIVTVKEDLLFEKCINFLLSKNISFSTFTENRIYLQKKDFIPFGYSDNREEKNILFQGDNRAVARGILDSLWSSSAITIRRGDLSINVTQNLNIVRLFGNIVRKELKIPAYITNFSRRSRKISKKISYSGEQSIEILRWLYNDCGLCYKESSLDYYKLVGKRK